MLYLFARTLSPKVIDLRQPVYFTWNPRDHVNMFTHNKHEGVNNKYNFCFHQLYSMEPVSTSMLKEKIVYELVSWKLFKWIYQHIQLCSHSIVFFAISSYVGGSIPITSIHFERYTYKKQSYKLIIVSYKSLELIDEMMCIWWTLIRSSSLMCI